MSTTPLTPSAQEPTWIVREIDGEIEVIEEHYPDEFSYIATVHGHWDDTEAMENARLIAAAPELRTVLKDAIDQLLLLEESDSEAFDKLIGHALLDRMEEVYSHASAA